jgi:hypothetical protein
MLLETLASGLQGSELSRGLRSSVWLYPLINSGHVIGVALLFGAIVPVDLRLMGLWKHVPLDHMTGTSVPVAIAGLVLALATGSLLFLTRPLDYIDEPLFGWKLALLGAAVLNALLLRRAPTWNRRTTEDGTPAAWGLSAAASIVLWLSVITLGRLIGYR